MASASRTAVRAFSIAADWSYFTAQTGEFPRGSVRDWSLRRIVFEAPQKPGVRSKIWATGKGSAGAGGVGTVSHLAFTDVSIGNVPVTAANHAQHFALGAEAHPFSAVGGNVGNVTFASTADLVEVEAAYV